MEGPSKYGGVAAAMVFGIGLLLTGRVNAGVSVLGIVSLLFICVLPFSARPKLLYSSFIFALFCGLLTYHAVQNEKNGAAIYHYFQKGRRDEPVTQSTQPAKFRSATNLLWGSALGCFLISAASLKTYRNLAD